MNDADVRIRVVSNKIAEVRKSISRTKIDSATSRSIRFRQILPESKARFQLPESPFVNPSASSLSLVAPDHVPGDGWRNDHHSERSWKDPSGQDRSEDGKPKQKTPERDSD